jgi:hypothetical protein
MFIFQGFINLIQKLSYKSKYEAYGSQTRSASCGIHRNIIRDHMRTIISRLFVGQLVTIPTEPSQIPSLLQYQLNKFCVFMKIYFTKPNSGTVIKFSSMSGAINTCFGTWKELILHSSCGSVHIEAMSTLCPEFLTFHGKLNKQNSVFSLLKFPMSLALAKHNHDSWKISQNQEPEGC